MLYRRFGTVFSRLLLNKQDEISRIEATLYGMDKMDEAQQNGQFLMSRALDVDRDGVPEAWRGETRPLLMDRLEKKTLEYGECYCSAEWFGEQLIIAYPSTSRFTTPILQVR
jgi:hypothetical protein